MIHFTAVLLPASWGWHIRGQWLFFGSRQRETLPPTETPLPIKELIQLENSIFTVEWKWQKLICHLRSILLQCHFSQKKNP